MDTNEPEISRYVIEMITVANDYCLFTESIEKYTREDVLSYLQKVCPLLYVKGALLPYVNVANPEANERYITEENWEVIYKDTKAVLGKVDEFWSIGLHDNMDAKPTKYSIAEFVADVYQDMKDFLLLYQKNTKAARENAVAENRLLFLEHWGWRVIDIQRAVNYTLYKNEIDQQEYLI